MTLSLKYTLLAVAISRKNNSSNLLTYVCLVW